MARLPRLTSFGEPLGRTWDPFPITGRSINSRPPHGQAVEARRNQGLIIGQRGGIPDAQYGHNKPQFFRHQNKYSVALNTQNYSFTTLLADMNGDVGAITLSSVVGEQSTFLHTIDFNIALFTDEADNAVLKTSTLSISGTLLHIPDNGVLWTYATTVPSVAQRSTGVSLPIPDIRFDEWTDVYRDTENFQNVRLQLYVVVNNNDAANPHVFTLVQNWRYFVEDIQ